MKGNRGLQCRGFTLIEIMIVVAIVGVLAAVAIPALVGYVRKSKTSELGENLDKCYKGVVDYYDKPHFMTAGVSKSAVLPNSLAKVSPNGCAAATLSGDSGYIDWNALGPAIRNSYKTINFMISDAVYACYQYELVGPRFPLADANPIFTCHAWTDIDDDGDVGHWAKNAAFMLSTNSFRAGGVWHDGMMDDW